MGDTAKNESIRYRSISSSIVDINTNNDMIPEPHPYNNYLT